MVIRNRREEHKSQHKDRQPDEETVWRWRPMMWCAHSRWDRGGGDVRTRVLSSITRVTRSLKVSSKANASGPILTLLAGTPEQSEAPR